MELCCATAAPRGLSAALPGRLQPNPRHSLPLLPAASDIRFKGNPIPFSNPGLRFSRRCSLRATTSEDTPSISVQEQFGTVVDGSGEEKTDLDEKSPYEAPKVAEEKAALDEKAPSEASTVVEYEEQTPSGDEQSEALDFLNNLDLKLDSGDTYSILAYGAGALVALWISSAVVGALDSVPLLPKLMEIVGLGFTVWFSYRYLIFKENRDELFAKFEDLKEQILGPSD